MADNATKIVITAEDRASAAFGKVQQSMGSLAGAVPALAGALSAGSMVAWVKGTLDAADSMNDLSQKVGIAVKDLGGWKLASESSGTSMESVARGVKGLSGYMRDHATELKAAGITATDAGGAMTQLADIFQAMPDGVEKTNLAVKLFGKAGMDMIPMLNMGSQGLAEMQEKAAEYGKRLAILAPQADKFNDLLAEMALQSKVVGINIGIELVPSMIKFAEQLIEGKKIAGGWLGAMWEFGVLLSPTEGIPEGLNRTRVQLEKLHAEMAKGKEQNLADGGMTDLSEIDRNIGLGQRQKKYLEFLQRQKVMADAGKLGDYRDSRDLRLTNGATMSEAEAMAAAKKLNRAGAAGAGAKPGRGIDDENDVLFKIREAVEKRDRAFMNEKDKAAATEVETMEKLRQKYIAVADPLQQYRVQLDEINTLRAAGKLTADQAIEAEWAVNEVMDKTIDKMNGVGDAGKDTFADLTAAIESWGSKAADTFADFVVDGKASFGDLVNSMLKGIARLQAKKMLDPITKGASDWLGGALGSGFGGLFGSGGSSAATSEWDFGAAMPDMGLSFAGGGYTGGGPRSGGLDGQGGFMAMLHPQESVIDHARSGGGGTAPDVIINLVNQTGSPATARQQGAPSFDGSNWVISVIMEAAGSNPGFRAAMGLGR
jgi:hypothetical protein